MNMASSTSNMASSMAMASSAASASSTDMSMGDKMGSCKISMTWNWYTIGACFISTSWRITSRGMFAGSCIGVICLVILLEFLRRVQREYDGYLRKQNESAWAAASSGSEGDASSARGESQPVAKNSFMVGITRRLSSPSYRFTSNATLFQRQFVRAMVHMLQFAVAYFVMLLAMYYNGYIIISILIGAFLGSFIFSWDQLANVSCQEPMAADVTGCCG